MAQENENRKQGGKAAFGRSFLNRKVLLGMLTLLSCMAIIIVSSFFPFIFEPERWQTKEFLSDELIIVAISITAIVSTLFIGQSGNSANPKSEIAKAKVDFETSVKKITSIGSFYQWVRYRLQPNDRKSVERRLMREVGIKDPTILGLEPDEIRSLEAGPGHFGERYYSQLDKEQVRVLLDIKSGKINVRMVEPNYYLTTSTINSDLTISEKSGRESKKKAFIMVISVMWKIVFSVVIAMIFASFVLDKIQEGDVTPAQKAASWMKFASRIFALVTSATMGYRIGTQNNDIDADFIRMRISVHELYIQDTGFQPMTDEEIAKMEYDEAVAQREKARKTTLSVRRETDNGTDRGNNNENGKERTEGPDTKTGVLD